MFDWAADLRIWSKRIDSNPIYLPAPIMLRYAAEQRFVQRPDNAILDEYLWFKFEGGRPCQCTV